MADGTSNDDLGSGWLPPAGPREQKTAAQRLSVPPAPIPLPPPPTTATRGDARIAAMTGAALGTILGFWIIQVRDTGWGYDFFNLDDLPTQSLLGFAFVGLPFASIGYFTIARTAWTRGRLLTEAIAIALMAMALGVMALTTRELLAGVGAALAPLAARPIASLFLRGDRRDDDPPSFFGQVLQPVIPVLLAALVIMTARQYQARYPADIQVRLPPPAVPGGVIFTSTDHHTGIPHSTCCPDVRGLNLPTLTLPEAAPPPAGTGA